MSSFPAKLPPETIDAINEMLLLRIKKETELLEALRLVDVLRRDIVHLSNRQIALQLGVSEGAVSLYKTGRRTSETKRRRK